MVDHTVFQNLVNCLHEDGSDAAIEEINSIISTIRRAWEEVPQEKRLLNGTLVLEGSYLEYAR